MVHRKVFQSSHLEYAEYDDATGKLIIRFVNDTVYEAPYVPPSWWKGLTSSVSPGSFFNRVMRGMDSLQKVKL